MEWLLLGHNQGEGCSPSHSAGFAYTEGAIWLSWFLQPRKVNLDGRMLGDA